MGMMTQGLGIPMLARRLGMGGTNSAQPTFSPLPSIAKNTILRDRINDEQSRLAKQGPIMVRNPKKTAKGA